MRTLHLTLIVCGSIALCDSTIRAQTIVWTNTSSGNWSTAANWSPNVIPGQGNAVIINQPGVTVTLNSTTAAGSITLGTNSGATVTLSMNNQTLTMYGPLTVNSSGSFTVNGGVLYGNTNTGNTMLNGTIGFTAGAMEGILTLSGSGTLNINGSALNMDALYFTNNGTVIWSSGTIQSGNGSIIDNYGLWNMTSDQTMNNAYGGAGAVFNNYGTLRKSGGGPEFSSYTVFTSGVVLNQLAGVLDIQNGVGTNGLELALQGGGNFTGGYITTNQYGLTLLSAGNFNINGTVTGTNTWEDSGNLSGACVINGALTWVGGTWNSAPSVTIATNSALLLVGGGDLNMDGCQVTNNGTVIWSSGTIQSGNGSVINNYNLWNLTSDQVMNNAYGGVGAVFNNYGTFLKSAGATNSSTTITAGVVFNTTGLVEVASGVLNLQGGGGFTNNTFSGSGTVDLTSATYTLSGNVTQSGLLQMTLNGAVLSGTTGVLVGNWVWTAGSFGPLCALTVASGSALTLNGGGYLDLYGALTDEGNIQIESGIFRPRADQGAGRLIIVPGGVLDVQSNALVDTYSGGTIYNQGLLRKSSGTNTTTINPPLFSSGTVEVDNGIIALAGGASFTNSALTGPGTLDLAGNGTYTVFGNFTQSGLGLVQLAGGILTGTNATLIGNWGWSSGYFAPTCALTLATNSLLTLSGGGYLDLYGSLTNAGTMRIASGTFRPRADQGAGRFTTLPGAVVDVQSNTLIDTYGGGTFYNAGTLRKSSGSNTTAFNPPLFNSGTVDVESGVMSFANGGTFSPGTVFVGPSNSILSGGTFIVTGNVTFSNVIFTTALTGNDGVMSGTMTWSNNGNFPAASTLTLATNGTLNVMGTSVDLDLYGAFTNAGTMIITSGTFRPRADQGPGELVNLSGALVNIVSDVLIDQYSGGKIVNQGTFRKSGGTNVTTINPSFTNTGILDAQAAVMELAGSYDLTNGTLNFGINSLTNFGQIILSGAAALTGTASANLNNGYVPVAGNAFPVLSFGSKTNLFTATNLPFADAWSTNYTATNFVLTVLNARPVLTAQTNRAIDELTTLTITNTATDFDQPPQTLTFSLAQGPGAMTINPATGVLTWTPAQTNSPSTNTVTVVVTDNGAPPLSASNTFTVTVIEVNVAPSLPVIGTQTVNELTLLTVTNTATNANIHSTNIGYGLVNPPAGMSINSNGIITWTPAQTQSPGTNTITTVVTNSNPYDQINPELVSTNTFTVIVKEVNVAPTLPAVSNQTVNVLAALTVTNTASETNIHAVTSSYHLTAATGATISASGVITWTPAQSQGPSTNTFTTIVTNTDMYDTVNPHLSATNSFQVIVYAPSMQPITSHTINAGQSINITPVATDNDPTRILSFTLLEGPAGATLNTNTGAFHWQAPVASANSTNVCQIEVTANSAPPDSVSQTFDIDVKPLTPVTLTALAKTTTNFSLQVNGESGPQYILQYTKSLDTPSWTSISTNTPGTLPFTITTTNISTNYEFYRIKLGP